MGLSGLDAALSGLRISQQQISVLSNNIANVSTPGFTRKILPQSTQAIAGVSVGVLSDTIIRKVDVNLARDLWTQVSGASFNGIQETYLNKIQQFHGPPDKELSVAATISDLKDAFSALSDSPEDTSLQNTVVNQAVKVAGKINDLSKLIGTLRSDSQTEMQSTVGQINTLLKQIANFNGQIASNGNTGRSVATLQDGRDNAIKDLSGLIGISFFQRADGVMVVQTTGGVQLADSTATTLTFRPNVLSASSVYPESAAAIYVGDPLTNPSAPDITTAEAGGKLGGLISLRDDIFPKEQAQLDELAQKLAQRFDSQGLRLFTDNAGNIPADTAPNASVPTPVSYIGFASKIQVNQSVLDNHALLQQGTVPTDLPVQTGSNEVVRRVIEYTFGNVEFQQAAGAADIRASAHATDLQSWLGVFSNATVNGTRNIALPNFTDINDLVASADGNLDNPKDQFQISFAESRTALGPSTITVDLSAAQAAHPIGGAIHDGLDQIIAEINAQITAAAVPGGLAAVASRGANGQIVISSRGNVTVSAGGANGMGATGLNYLGLSAATTTTTDPYFDIKVGNGTTTRVTVEPGDDETDLLNKLNYLGGSDTVGVPGLGASISATTGFLTIRPGDNADPNLASFGGDFTILSGPFTTTGAGGIGVPANINIVSALFGSYNSGPPLQNITPITSVNYGSSVSSTNSAQVGFRSDYLGAHADISTGIAGGTSLVDYAQKMVNQQTQELTNASSSKEDSETLRDTLQTQLNSDSGVNLDEELSQLIVFQTAFAASARVINAVNDLFAQLLNAVV